MQRHICRSPWVALLLCSSAISTGLCQSDFEPLDAAMKMGSARALSMGGVYITVNEGCEALNGNPAGLADLSGPEVQICGRCRLAWQADFPGEAYDYWQEYGGTYNNYAALHYAAYAMPFICTNIIKAAVGCGYRNSYDWRRHKTLRKKRVDNGNGLILERESHTIDGGIAYMSTAIGILVADRLSCGFSLNLPVRAEYQNLYECDGTYYGNSYTWDSFEKRRVKATALIQCGAIVALGSRAKLGVLCTLPHTYTIGEGTVRNRFNDEVYRYDIQQGSLWRIPATIDLGFSIYVRNTLLIALDMHSRPWKNYRVNDMPIGDVAHGTSYRCGMEYGGILAIRGGFALERLPITDFEGNAVDAKTLTLGCRYSLYRCTLELGGSYTFASYSAFHWRGEFDYFLSDMDIFISLKVS